MDFLKQHGEKLFFILLLAGLGFSVLTVLNLKGNFTPAKDVQQRTADVSLDTQNLEGMLAILTTDKPRLDTTTDSFTPSHRKLCINKKFPPTLIPFDAMVCPFCGETQEIGEDDETDRDGVSTQLESDLGMDPDDPRDVFEDQDDDGFITKVELIDANGDGLVTTDELEKGYNPIDPTSYPPLIDYLRLEELEQKSILMEFLGFNQLREGVYSLQLRWRYPGENRWNRGFIRTGSRFGRNKEFQAVSYTEKRTQRPDGTWKDESHATIQVGEKVLKLGRYKPESRGRITESLAKLHLIAGPKWSEDVRVGSAFEIDKISYKVIDIQNDSVVVKTDDSETPLTIRRATQEEIDRLNPPKPDPQPGMEGMPPDGMIPPDFFNPQY